MLGCSTSAAGRIEPGVRVRQARLALPTLSGSPAGTSRILPKCSVKRMAGSVCRGPARRKPWPLPLLGPAQCTQGLCGSEGTQEMAGLYLPLVIFDVC